MSREPVPDGLERNGNPDINKMKVYRANYKGSKLEV